MTIGASIFAARRSTFDALISAQPISSTARATISPRSTAGSGATRDGRPRAAGALASGCTAATGHSLQYLRMPRAALEAFPTGLVHREAERVVGLLRDPEATGVVVVTLAEEMPTNETFDMVRGLDELGMHTATLVVNQVHEARGERLERGPRHAQVLQAVSGRGTVDEHQLVRVGGTGRVGGIALLGLVPELADRHQLLQARRGRDEVLVDVAREHGLQQPAHRDDETEVLLERVPTVDHHVLDAVEPRGRVDLLALRRERGFEAARAL